MSISISQLEFKGAFGNELAALHDLIEKLWDEHGMSFVKAGDDKVYAFGGNKSMVVFDESKWEGLIELITPIGNVTIKPGENGEYIITGNNLDEPTIQKVLISGVKEISEFYQT